MLTLIMSIEPYIKMSITSEIPAHHSLVHIIFDYDAFVLIIYKIKL